MGPFNKTESDYRYTTAPTQGYELWKRYSMWYTSPRDGAGKLHLIPQPYTLNEHRVLAYTRVFKSGWAPVLLAPASRAWASSHFEYERALATNAAYQRLIDKINNDTSAGLGVAVATWRQSWDMVGGRMRGVARIAKRLYKPPRPRPPFKIVKSRGRHVRVPNKPRLNRRGVEHGSSADLFLEGSFGWVPLISDAYNAALQLCEDVPYGWVRGSATREGTREYDVGTHRLTAMSHWRCTQSLRVKGVNPNMYILNQLGLINPALVLWDIVPWSFVVGWFGSFQAVLSSFSDLYGVNYEHGNVTWTERYVDTEWKANAYPVSHPGYAYSSKSLQTRTKSRLVGGIAKPSLVFRMPGVGMQRSLIAAALAAQQVRRLSTSL